MEEVRVVERVRIVERSYDFYVVREERDLFRR